MNMDQHMENQLNQLSTKGEHEMDTGLAQGLWASGLVRRNTR